jgi:Pyruvate/2-oxoacid:ferredoxin oxidoreductase gamma subunit
MLGEDDYPSREAVLAALSEASSHILVLDPEDRPTADGRAAAANIFTLGALFGAAAVTALIAPSVMEQVLADRWPRVAGSNLLAFRAGFVKGNSRNGEFPGELHDVG